MSSLKRYTGMLGTTEPGQIITRETIHELNPGSVIRNPDGSRIIYLHDNKWLYCSDRMWCYDNIERMKSYLDEKSVACHLS